MMRICRKCEDAFKYDAPLPTFIAKDKKRIDQSPMLPANTL